MLIRFSVGNFRSIDEPITLNMVSSSKIREHASHAINLNSVKVLRDAVIYGANAAGKSNIIMALEYMTDSVRSGKLKNEAESWFYRGAKDGSSKNTVFDIQYESDGDFFDYGFSCSLSQGEVLEEWLYDLNSETPKQLFRRNTASSIDCDLEDASELSKKRIEVYVSDFISDTADNPGKLFLSSLNQGKHYDEESGLSSLAKAYRWIIRNIEFYGTKNNIPKNATFYLKDLDKAGEMLATFDTGIESIHKEKIPFDELKRYVPMEVMASLQSAIESSSSSYALTLRAEDLLAGIEKEEGQSPTATILKIRHEGSDFDFDFRDESAGTIHLFDLLDMLLMNSEDSVFIVDELSRGLHPLLTKHFIDLFNEIHAKDKCQLIFTTHENDVMDFDHFRRDEIWFIERNPQGASYLYPLDDFTALGSVRSDTRIGKNYMNGRYGGIPVLSLEKSMSVLED